MTTTSKSHKLSLHFHPAAYQFVDAALRYTQKQLGRTSTLSDFADDEDAHITGEELLEGIRQLALKEFGLMSRTVFDFWGIRSTDDFGRVVFDFIERGVMRKTERDQISDFYDVYDFEQVFDREYQIDTSKAFRS